MQRIARGRFIRNCSSLQGWAAPRAFEVIVERAERVPRLVRLMILFLFGEQNELYPRPWWWYLAVIYDFRASTCILRPRTSMHLRVHQALVIGRAFVRYHPYPLRFFVSASSFHFFSFVFFFSSFVSLREVSRIRFTFESLLQSVWSLYVWHWIDFLLE